jgi:hypothetical protein
MDKCAKLIDLIIGGSEQKPHHITGGKVEEEQVRNKEGTAGREETP